MRLRAGLFPGLLRLVPHLGGHCSLASVSAPLPPGSLGGQGAGSGRRTALVLQLKLDLKGGCVCGGVTPDVTRCLQIISHLQITAPL